MSDVSQQPQARYKFVPYGGGVQELDRFALAQQIRAGEVTADTHLAIVGSDEWKPAASYPELVRYFELAAARPVTSGGYVPAPAAPREMQSMGQRIVEGMAYPFNGSGFMTLAGLAILSGLPFISLLAALATPVVVVDIVRRSADGKTKISALIDTSNVADMFWLYFRLLFMTLICMAPLIAVTVWAVWGMVTQTVSLPVAAMAILGASAFGAIYYPACLATLAVWDNVLSSLDPRYVFKVISIIGADYFVVIIVWFIATGLSIFMRILSPFRFIPFVGGMFSSFIALYVTFYASHLLGYAVYRHLPELGWE